MTDQTMTLSEFRRKIGLSQSQLAEKMGVTAAQVSKIEAQYPDVMFTALRRYMDGLGVEVRFFFDHEKTALDVSSSEIVHDETRILAEGRKKDPTRRAATK